MIGSPLDGEAAGMFPNVARRPLTPSFRRGTAQIDEALALDVVAGAVAVVLARSCGRARARFGDGRGAREVEVARGASFGTILDQVRARGVSAEPGACRVLVVDAVLDGAARAASDIVVIAGAALSCDFATDVLDRRAAGYLLDQIAAVARQGQADPDRPVDTFELLGEAERQRLLPARPAPRTSPSRRLHQVIAERAREAPDAVAVSCAGEQLTYGALEVWADALAANLRDLGVRRGDRVGIELERSLALVVAMLGAWKAGAAYVPIDPRVPLARRREVLALAAPRVLVTHDAAPWATDAWSCAEMPARSSIGAAIEVPGDDSDAAYVLFTSGSTGQPKGVEVSHHNVARLFTTTDPLFAFRAGDTWLNAHNVTFDASVWEIFGALVTGGRVVIAPRETTRDPRAMVDLVHAERVAMVTISPTAFDGFRDAALERDEPFTALRYVVLCAEALSPAALGAWFDRWGDEQPALVNMYGITETTVHSTHHRLTAADARDPRRKIGTGLPDTPIYVLDDRGVLVPFGATGEIFVGGPGVSRGYLGAPPAHAHRFTDDPFAGVAGARMYRSGDLARWLPDGTLEYLGRLDKQVKIRGHRVELGEVEAALLAHPEVRAARGWLAQRADGTAALAAAVVAVTGAQPEPGALRTFLTARLPEYMVPAGIVVVAALPQTANGKLDTARLPDPFAQPVVVEAEVEAGEVDERVAGVARAMAAVLGVAHVGPRDSFFERGGDSITAVRLSSRLRALGLGLSVSQIYRARTPIALGRLVELRDTVPAVSGSRTSPATEGIVASFPATRLQLGMFLHGALAQGTYHDILRYTLDLVPAEAELRAAVRAVVAANPVLRASFVLAGPEGPRQRIHDTADLVCEVVDWRGLAAEALEERGARWAAEERTRPFVETEPGLIRFFVHRIGEAASILSLSVHHAILDGWSAASLVTELLVAYQRIRAGEAPATKPDHDVLRRYVELEREAEGQAEPRAFWRDYLIDVSPAALEAAEPPGGVAWPVAEETVTLSAAAVQRLERSARLAGVPTKSVHLAAHTAVLAFLTGQTDVVTGLITNGRLEEEGGEEALGLFLNTVPMRLAVTDQRWSALIRDAFAQETEIYPHRRLPLERIQREAGVRGLCRTAFNYTDFHVYERLRGIGLQVRDVRYLEETDFALFAAVHRDPFGGGATLTVSHRLGEVGAAYARAYVQLFQWLADEADVADEAPIADRLVRRAQALGLVMAIDAAADPAVPATALALVTEPLRRSGGVAVVHGACEVTYGALAARISALRAQLIVGGATRGARIACFLDRGPDALVALLGSWAAGACYVPIDPALPPGRQRMLVAIAGCQLAVRSRTVDAAAWDGPMIVLGDAVGEPDVDAWALPDGEDEAYVLFTSGSTGEPKGVAMPHRAIANLIAWQIRQPELARPRRVSQFAALSFDVSIQELLGAVASASTLVVVEESVRRNPEALLTFLADQRIEVAFLPPVALRQLADAYRVFEVVPSCLTHIIAAGEALVVTGAMRALCAAAGAELVNHYGPTETHVVTCHRLGPDVAAWPERPPIGQPIDHVTLAVLDACGRPVSSLAIGVLHVAGVAVARGYLGHAPAGGFVSPGQYRTGDLVRLQGGELVFVGRADHQLKIRGHRVEPGEVAAVLERHPAVAACVVRAIELDGHGRVLVAFVVPAGPAPSLDELVAHARAVLPEVAWPQHVEILDQLPTTRTGKIDLRALPRPRLVRRRPEFQGSVSPAERRVLGVWSRVLGHEVSSPVVSFFDAGGDSLLTLALYLGLRAEYGVAFPMHDLFRFPTARSFAARPMAGEPPIRPQPPTAGLARRAAVRITELADRRRSSRRQGEPQ